MTEKNRMVVPEVMGDMIDAKIAAQLKITPYAKVDNSLQGVAGDTVKYPCWNYVGDAVDVEEGAEVALSDMSTTTSEFTIKKAMKAIGLTEEAVNSGYGDPIGQATSQLAKAIAGKVDTDILETAYTAPMVVNKSSAPIGYDAIVDAVTKFEDEEDGVEKVMFIHPRQETSLLKDDAFLSADKFQAGVAVNGAIGKIAGCWIKKSSKVKESGEVTAVAGVYKVTIGGTVASGDKITVAGVDVTLDTTSGASATAAATAVKTAFASNADYSATSSGGVVTLTEKSGKEGTGEPKVSITSASGTIAVTTTTQGVSAASACYICPIIKLEPDSIETEYTETEAPALTIFLKKDTQTDAEWKPRTQTHEITTAKYYGVGLTNASKIVLAKFGK